VTWQDEETPLRKEHYSLALSCLSLHWSEDLEGTFRQIRESLRPDSPVMGVMLGQGTVAELSAVLSLAQMERRGG
jgi:NADH dehydrogenase [ubiquinone] 1 alpha subcomplex assembly factor 5